MRNTTTRTTPNLMAIDLAGCRINSDTPHLCSQVAWTARDAHPAR